VQDVCNTTPETKIKLIKGYLETTCISSYSRHRREFTAGITLISEDNAYLDVSFLALSEDNFFTVTKEMGDYSRYPGDILQRKRLTGSDRFCQKGSQRLGIRISNKVPGRRRKSNKEF